MNIDEAIEILTENDISDFYFDHTECCNFSDEINYRQAVETLINEYNNLKQIEEAHRIENGELRVELQQEKENYDKLTKHFIENHISKDKIKEKIEELENLIETNSLYEECWNKIEILKELLEE